MAVKINGLKSLLSELENLYGKRNIEKAVDKALIAGAEVIANGLRKNFHDFEDTGASIREITITNPRSSNGRRLIQIHWKGEEDRWKIIHMNEYGTIKNPNPRGKGKIDQTLREGQKRYYDVIQQEISRLIS